MNFGKLAPLLASSFAILSAGPARTGEPVSAGPELQINQFSLYPQQKPAVAATLDGAFLVVWSSYLQDGSASGIFGRRIGPAGTPVGAEIQLNATASGDQSWPAVATGADEMLVVWQDQGRDGSASGIFGRVLGTDGQPEGIDVQVNAFTTGSQSDPAVAGSPDGESFFVVWSSADQDGSSTGVFGRLLGPVGQPLAEEVQVNVWTTNRQAFPDVTSLANGGFVVVWASDGQDGSLDGVYSRLVAADGSPIGGETRSNSTTASNQTVPSVASHPAGGFVVSWGSYAQDGDRGTVVARRHDAAGTPIGAEVQVNATTTSAQDRPDVVSDGAGGFSVVWEGWHPDPLGDVYLRSFGPDGLAAGSELRANSTTDQQQIFPVAAAVPGSLFVAWESEGQDGSEQGIFGRTFLVPVLLVDGFESGDTGRWSSP